mmetsp:Transcript_4995/g.13645  ORF Transcript_4995/g.13645 Transcript_4995/m.13645 type:complete len:236 (-) Transcript_4995:540-1247(-)
MATTASPARALRAGSPAARPEARPSAKAIAATTTHTAAATTAGTSRLSFAGGGGGEVDAAPCPAGAAEGGRTSLVVRTPNSLTEGRMPPTPLAARRATTVSAPCVRRTRTSSRAAAAIACKRAAVALTLVPAGTAMGTERKMRTVASATLVAATRHVSPPDMEPPSVTCTNAAVTLVSGADAAAATAASTACCTMFEPDRAVAETPIRVMDTSTISVCTPPAASARARPTAALAR